jgi:uncharacterized protein YukE
VSQAVVDPQEVRRFAHLLKRFNDELTTNLAGMSSQMVALGDSWRDQEHEKFRVTFEETVAVLQRFLNVSAEHIPFLLRKAERIEDYLHQR